MGHWESTHTRAIVHCTSPSQVFCTARHHRKCSVLHVTIACVLYCTASVSPIKATAHRCGSLQPTLLPVSSPFPLPCHRMSNFRCIMCYSSLLLSLNLLPCCALRGQVRDLMFFIEGQRTIAESGGASELQQGTVLPLPASSSQIRKGRKGGRGS